MEKLLGFNELPKDIHSQIEKVVEVWQKHMKSKLVGVYLHGSIALGAFNPESGDIDILVVVKNPIDKDKKLDIAREIIALDGCPRPLEMSAITLENAKNWKNPGNCVFHYSDYWTERYLKRFADPDTELYIVDNEFPDADVTSYIRLLNERGIVLYGEKIGKVFAKIPDEDFWAAITADVDDYDFHDYGARYLVSNVLILGRILSFKAEKRILSKYEAGLWMIDNVPAELKYLPERAMKIWFGGEECELPEDDLEKLREYLINEIEK